MTLNPNPAMTVEAFEVFLKQTENRGRLWELIQGEIKEKMPTEIHSIIAGTIIALLWIYIQQRGEGRVGPEMRHQRSEDMANSRLLDVSYFSDSSRPPVEQGAVPVYPDLVVEIKSPDDSYVEMRDKAHFYLAQGTKMVWLIYPAKHAMEVITADDVQWLTLMDTLTAEDLLPGFSVPVARIFQIDPSKNSK